MGTGEVVTMNPSYNYFTFSSSDSNIINTDNLLFDQSGNPYVEVLDAGNATISATLNNVIYPSLDPSIFEVKYLNEDIKGKTVNF